MNSAEILTAGAKNGGQTPLSIWRPRASGKRGTMTLPKEFRDELKLEIGAPLAILRISDGLILMLEPKSLRAVV